MRIIIETIPHGRQRYETVGDYRWDEDGTLRITVSDMKNPDMELLVGIHELVEAALCAKRGITDDVITGFDIGFEENRQPGDISEPGDDPAAPYGAEHCVATAVERLMCAQLGVKWADYERAVLEAGK